MTNTRLELDSGLHVPAPADGAAWYVSIHSIARDGQAVLIAPAGVQLKARGATPVTAAYTIRQVGLRKKTIVVEVTADGPLPALVVRAKPGAVPSGTSDGTELGRLGDGGTTARLEAPIHTDRPPRERTASQGLTLWTHPAAGGRSTTTRLSGRPSAPMLAKITA